MEAGRIVEEGPPRQILRDPRTDRLRRFLPKLVHVSAPMMAPETANPSPEP